VAKDKKGNETGRISDSNGSEGRVDTKEAARGKWFNILVALGVGSGWLTKKQKACPFCGGGHDRFIFDDRRGDGDYFCRQCGPGDGFQFLMKFHGWDFLKAKGEVEKIVGTVKAIKPKVERARMTREDVATLWKTARAITGGDAAGVYLSARGIRLAEWPKALHYVPRMWHAPSRKYHPCMLAAFRNNESGTLHRTYLAEVEPRRMFVPFGVPKGGAVMLFGSNVCMGVAEGIETALSASIIFKMPVWATCSEGMLRAWQPPPGAKRITIFGDNDSSFVGHRASYELAWRLARENYHVRVEIPMTPDTDWNDVLRDQHNDFQSRDLSELRIHDQHVKPVVSSRQPIPRA
jgi:putative DNA primase/helicase